eukprot:6201521-Pleurochrysis_carterae.AAC.2
MTGIGFDALEIYDTSTDYANEASRVAYPLTTYFDMAVVVSRCPSQQPTLASKAPIGRLKAFKQDLARAIKNFLLFALVALITCDDAAFNDHVAHLRGEAEAALAESLCIRHAIDADDGSS